jgi:hypothetical protein
MSDEKSQNLKGFLKQQYKDDGLKVELTSIIAIKYSYYHKIKFEIGNILKTLDVLQKIEQKKDILNLLGFAPDQNILIRQSLWYAIVVNYAKFFTAKDKDQAVVPHVKLESKDCYKNNDEDLLTHEHLMAIRNKLIAHGTKNEHEEVIPVLYLNIIPGTNELTCNLGIHGIGLISFSLEDLNKTKTLTETLAKWIEIKIEKISDKVYEEVNENDAQYWWDLAHKEKVQM